MPFINFLATGFKKKEESDEMIEIYILRTRNNNEQSWVMTKSEKYCMDIGKFRLLPAMTFLPSLLQFYKRNVRVAESTFRKNNWYANDGESPPRT